jgi:hypothetical protein
VKVSHDEKEESSRAHCPTPVWEEKCSLFTPIGNKHLEVAVPLQSLVHTPGFSSWHIIHDLCRRRAGCRGHAERPGAQFRGRDDAAIWPNSSFCSCMGRRRKAPPRVPRRRRGAASRCHRHECLWPMPHCPARQMPRRQGPGQRGRRACCWRSSGPHRAPVSSQSEQPSYSER